MTAERIWGVSLRDSQGIAATMAEPARHHDVIRTMAALGHSTEYIARCEQGFVTDLGRWLNRKEALEVARAAGQIIRESNPAFGLFSEDVW